MFPKDSYLGDLRLFLWVHAAASASRSIFFAGWVVVGQVSIAGDPRAAARLTPSFRVAHFRPPFFSGVCSALMSIALARYIRLYVTCSAPCSCNIYCRNVFRDSVQISALNVFTSSKCRRPGVAVQIFLVVWILATQRISGRRSFFVRAVVCSGNMYCGRVPRNV